MPCCGPWTISFRFFPALWLLCALSGVGCRLEPVSPCVDALSLCLTTSFVLSPTETFHIVQIWSAWLIPTHEAPLIVPRTQPCVEQYCWSKEAETCAPLGWPIMDVSRLVTGDSNSNNNNYNYASECTTHGRTSSNPGRMQPRVMPCNVIPSISIPKNAHQESGPPSYSYLRIHQAPLSPPEEGPGKCTLPSISSLLQGVDNISQGPEAKRHRPNPSVERDWDRRTRSYSSSQTIRDRPVLPPTPPLRPGSGFQDVRHSPTSSVSSRSIVSLPNPTAANPPATSEDSSRRRFSTASASQHSNRSSLSYFSQPESPYQPNVSQPVPFATSPIQPPTNATEYHRHHPQPPGIYAPPVHMHMHMQPPHHRPQIPGMPPTAAAAAWQHHHYFPPSGATTYPLNQDRYICRTCHKAFSRPSSLRIHSHSHTGEKPFRCPHVGCGKAFSVRSNMKRHERGCHTGRATTSSTLVT